jgi:hypothetical protein
LREYEAWPSSRGAIARLVALVVGKYSGIPSDESIEDPDGERERVFEYR